MDKPAKVYLEIKPEDRDKVARAKQARQLADIPEEYMEVAELGYHYGWEAVRDFLTDVINKEQLVLYVRAARKLEARRTYDNSIAGIASNSQKLATYKKLMNPYIKEMAN